jgi:Mg2+-importing ATPase
MNEVKELLSIPLEELYEKLETSENGLSEEEAKRRLEIYGFNELKKRRITFFQIFFFHVFNPIILLLLFASILSFFLGERIDAMIILTIIGISLSLDLIQEHKANKAAEMLKERVSITATVIREGKRREVKVKELVPGDIIVLSAGDIVPADCRVISAKDFFVDESSLTGESYPVEKDASKNNFLMMGSSVMSGDAIAVVIATGTQTEYWKIVKGIERITETEFERSLRRFGYMILEVSFVLIIFVFAVNAFFKRSIIESLLFSIALAVGLTPSLLPLILTLNLSSGAIRMSKKGSIVKKLSSIQNFGSIDVLCVDKTGTLTQNKITLVKYVDVNGKEDEKVLLYSYLNASYQTGMKNPLDEAIIEYRKLDISSFKKIDEIPFDYVRRRVSIVVEGSNRRILVTKGAFESIISICKKAVIDGNEIEIDEAVKKKIENTYREISSEGFRVLGLAIKEVETKDLYTKEDEKGMVFFGLIAFYDPPKESAKEAIKLIEGAGIEIKILTGDDEFVTRKVCEVLGFKIKGKIIHGEEIPKMTDEALERVVEKSNVFVRLTPTQKNRIVNALRKRHVVGFLGDGVNDAPSIKQADIGISVENAVDVAKESADIILTTNDLKVLYDGVIEGRRTIENTEKYIKMGISSNFGNMLSVSIGSIFLPFLPMLPTQILLNNLLYDISQLSLPLDNVDKDIVRKPKGLNTEFLKRFMIVFGSVSSIFDLIVFITFLFVLKASEHTFQTAWFLESLATQTLVIFLIRSKVVPFFKSKPNKMLVASVSSVIILALFFVYSPIGTLFKFESLDTRMVLIISLVVASYLLTVEATKLIFYKRIKNES